MSKLIFNKAVLLRLQVHEADGNTSITLSAETDKGEVDEERELEAIERIAMFLEYHGVRVRKMTRNTPDGDRADRIVLS